MGKQILSMHQFGKDLVGIIVVKEIWSSITRLARALDDDSRREWQQPRLMKTDETAERLGDLS
jgi:hypothetical protein